MLEGQCIGFHLGILFLVTSLVYIFNLVIRKIAKTCQSQGRLVGRIVVITGANSAIGMETTIDLARRGATVILACRDITLGNAAKKKILAEYGEGKNNHSGFNVQNPKPYYTSVKSDQLIVEQIDLSSLESVRQFAERVNSSHPKIDYLINNAGIYMRPFGRTRDGFEMNVGVNYLGHFLLTLLLLPSIREAGAQSGARIVNVSSLAHRFGKVPDLFPEHPEKQRESYGRFQAYADSRLAQVIHARELARRLQGTGVCAVSLHPGTCATNILRIPIIRTIVSVFGRLFLKTAREGAQTTIHAIMSPRIQNGGYYSDCDLAESHPLADDEVIAKKLWKSSERAVDCFMQS